MVLSRQILHGSCACSVLCFLVLSAIWPVTLEQKTTDVCKSTVHGQTGGDDCETDNVKALTRMVVRLQSQVYQVMEEVKVIKELGLELSAMHSQLNTTMMVVDNMIIGTVGFIIFTNGH